MVKDIKRLLDQAGNIRSGCSATLLLLQAHKYKTLSDHGDRLVYGRSSGSFINASNLALLESFLSFVKNTNPPQVFAIFPVDGVARDPVNRTHLGIRWQMCGAPRWPRWDLTLPRRQAAPTLLLIVYSPLPRSTTRYYTVHGTGSEQAGSICEGVCDNLPRNLLPTDLVRPERTIGWVLHALPTATSTMNLLSYTLAQWARRPRCANSVPGSRFNWFAVISL